MTDNKEQHLFPVDELGLDDATVKILKSGDLNVRLICEMIKNPAFANFMSDMEIYVDNLAAMQIHNMKVCICPGSNKSVVPSMILSLDTVIPNFSSSSVVSTSVL